VPQDNQYKLLTNNQHIETLPTRTVEPWQKDWIILLLLKILIGIFLPFFSDETYYWVWGKNLKLSYFDHPPFISWLFYLGTPLDHFLYASRLPTLILGHFTIWIWCAGIAKDYSSQQKKTLLWLLSVHALTGFGALVANPDVPFLFFWSLSILFYLRSIENPNSHKWSILLGAALGLGFTSKYLIALFVPIVFLHLVLSGKWRTVRWHQIIWPIVFGAIFSSCVWIWNYQNDWQSFRFQMHHGLGKKGWKLQWTTDFLLGTFALLFPPFVYIFFKDKVFKKICDFNVLLFSFLCLFFLYSTTGGDTELNWPLAVYPSFFFVLVPYLGKKSYRAFVGFFAIVGIVLISFVFLSPAISPHPRLNESVLYEEILAQAEKYQPLYTSTYQSASYFWFLKKRPFYKLRYSSRPDEYDSMAQSQPTTDSFYFLKEKYQNVPKEQLEFFNFEKVEDLTHNFEIYKATKR
jgi:4-amino-4-deoxy-L-arabinose transferase-like glycosyltransferase